MDPDPYKKWRIRVAQKHTDPDSVADPVCISRIRIFYPSRISDPGSKKLNKREGWKKNCCHNFLCSHKFHKIAIILVLTITLTTITSMQLQNKQASWSLHVHTTMQPPSKITACKCTARLNTNLWNNLKETLVLALKFFFICWFSQSQTWVCTRIQLYRKAWI